MIDCPVCHVKNDDDSRFCQECGQRLTPAAASPINTQKLKSPLLSGSSYDSSDDKPQNEIERLKKMSSHDKNKSKNINELPKGNPFDPRRNNIESQTDNANAEKKGIGKKGLHSPLLSGDEYEEEDFIEEEESVSFRSTKLVKNPNTSISSPRQGKGLRSPILSGGGSEQYFEEEDDEELFDDDDNPNPNILRSPLLAAKMPIVDHHHPIHEAPKNNANVNAPVNSQVNPSVKPQFTPINNAVPNQNISGQNQAKTIPPIPTRPSEIQDIQQPQQPTKPFADFPKKKPVYEQQVNDEDEQFDTINIRHASSRAISNLSQNKEQKSSSVFKFIGICAVFILLIKLYCLIGYANSDWFKFSPFVIDQFLQIAIIICLILVCLLPRN